MIIITSSGDFNKSFNYLGKLHKKDYLATVAKYAQIGVKALADATPKDSGFTAESWYSEIEEGNGTLKVYWKNSNIIKDYFSVAIGLQIGHGTGTGGYVQGQDYITPALEPVFREIEEAIRKEVKG